MTTTYPKIAFGAFPRPPLVIGVNGVDANAVEAPRKVSIRAFRAGCQGTMPADGFAVGVMSPVTLSSACCLFYFYPWNCNPPYFGSLRLAPRPPHRSPRVLLCRFRFSRLYHRVLMRSLRTLLILLLSEFLYRGFPT